MPRPHRIAPAALSVAARFTLIELLVVIAIIGILASLLLPALQRTQERGRQIVCLGNLRSVGFGALMYAEDANGRLPGPTPVSSTWWWWANPPSNPYGAGNGVFGQAVGARGVDPGGILRCPTDLAVDRSNISATGLKLSYGMNSRLNNIGPGTTVGMQEFKEPTRTIMLADGDRELGGYLLWENFVQMRLLLGDWHEGFCNAVHLDGHAERRDRQEIARDDPTCRSHFLPNYPP